MSTDYTKRGDKIRVANLQLQKRDTEVMLADHVTGVETAINHENAQHMEKMPKLWYQESIHRSMQQEKESLKLTEQVTKLCSITPKQPVQKPEQFKH